MKIVEVSGPSMEPTLKNGQLLIIRSIKDYSKLKRGDIIITTINDIKKVKRLIGLPNDNVKLSNNSIEINDTEISEKYLKTKRYIGSKDFQWELKENEYVVLGDNGHASIDSRDHGPILINRILAQVVLRLWPPGRIH